MLKKWFGFGKKEEPVEEAVEEVVEEETLGDEEPEAVEESAESEEVVESEVTEVSQESEVAEESVAPVVEPVEESDLIEDAIEIFEEIVEEIEEEIEEEELEEAIEALIAVESFPLEEEISVIAIDQEGELLNPEKKISFFERLKQGLTKTTRAFTDTIDNLFNQYDKIDDDLYEELEEILIMADIGMETTLKIIERLKLELVKRKISDPGLVKPVLKDVISELLTENNNPKLNIDKSPSILFVIGVNGAGKTTTIGKIARSLKMANKTVILAAADTFRAAAIDQLMVWGERAGVPVISQNEGSDPAAVVYDSIRAAKARKTDVLIIDTAGRLHNKVNLMNELTKIFKVIEREFPEAEKEVLLVLDATTGQNGLQQAKLFKESANITGIVLTKLDGTAKGGIVLAINNELGIPIKLIGVGEGINDLQVFDAKNFADALIGE